MCTAWSNLQNLNNHKRDPEIVKAEKAAAAGKRKWLTLVKKHDDATKNIEKLKTLHGKRGPENQSPGKEGEEKPGSGTKGRNQKKKTKEEIELEKSFFN